MAGVDEHGVRAQAGSLAPGGVIGDGRYRLLAQFGVDSRMNAQLWRARDGQLSRDVALTVILGNPSDSQAAGRARRTLDRAAHAARFHHDGISRVLDVLSLGRGILASEGLLGMVVTEWTAGTDLLDLIADGPVAASTAVALLEPLAAAVDEAHHSGLVIGVDHPQRLRLLPEGALRLAFPGPMPESTLRDDVKGLGAILYLLLTARWPLPGGPEAVPAAPTGPDGRIVAPRILQPETPPELSNLAVRCLEDSAVGGIRTSAAILQVLDRMATSDPETVLISKVGGGGGSTRENDTEDNTVWTTRKPVKDPARQRRLALALGVLAVATLAIAVWIVAQVIGFFFDSSGSGSGPKVSASTSVSAPPTTHSSSTQPPPATPVKPDDISVFNVSGTPDYPGRAKLAIDGDPGTEWKTEGYFEDFPALKPGEGLISTFGQPTKFAEVDITTHDPGTVVEIRTSE
ncbi:MAG: protein kinase family protein, partial [Sciscionella sp.]